MVICRRAEPKSFAEFPLGGLQILLLEQSRSQQVMRSFGVRIERDRHPQFVDRFVYPVLKEQCLPKTRCSVDPVGFCLTASRNSSTAAL